MIPMPTKWQDLAPRVSRAAWIVKITPASLATGIPVIYLAESEMHLGADHVYGFLRSVSEFGRGVDVYKSSYNAARAVVTIRDAFYQKYAGDATPSRFSDEYPMTSGSFAILHDADIELLAYPGSYATVIADCLSIYQGTVTKVHFKGEDLVLFTDERRRIVHRDLPQRRFTRTLFPKMPADTENETMPLVYGHHWEQEVLRKTGFAPARRIDNWKWLVADHVIDAFPTEHRHGATGVQGIMIWIDELQSWAKSYVGVTFNTNDSGRATFTIDPDTAGFDVYLYPTASYPTSTGSDAANLRGIEAARDYDAATKLSVIANSTTQAEVVLEWRQQGDESDDDKNNSVAELPGPATPLYGFQMYASKPVGITISSATIDWWNGSGWVNFASSIDVTSTEFIHYAINVATNLFYGTAESMRWHLGSGPAFTSPGAPDRKPFKVRIRFNGTGWTANSTVVAYIHEARMIMSCRTPRDSAVKIGTKIINERVREINVLGQYTGRTVWVQRAIPVADIDTRVIGASVQGREYGSWIDNGGRSNSHNVGDHITTAPGIVESLCRDELAVVNADIDQPSFDAAMTDATYNRTAKLHVKSDARLNSKAIIERLCWEHGMALVHRPNGQLRLLRWPGSGELVATLSPDDLYEQMPEIESTETGIIKNRLTLQYNRMADSGRYLRTQISGPALATSVTRYEYQDDEFQLQSHSDITSAPKAIFDVLLDDYALLAMPHQIVRFTTRGYRFAHAELGDHFLFSSADWVRVRLRLGNFWVGQELMVYDMIYKPHGIQFTCINWEPE